MTIFSRLGALSLFVAVSASGQAFTVESVFVLPTSSQACDVSAAARVDDNTFIAATDEMDSDGVNRLHVYHYDERQPVASVDLTPAVAATGLPTSDKPDDRENDIEGAARIGNRIYWLTSHGPNKNGKPRPDRKRLFATDLGASNAVALARGPQIFPAYAKLLDDLKAVPVLSDLKLGSLDAVAPENGGVNIESLSANKDDQLLIGLRSPLDANGRAIVIPLLNAPALIAGEAGRATFGDPIRLDLNRRGIRDMLYLPDIDAYVILAGSPKDLEDFALFTWRTNAQPIRVTRMCGGLLELAGLHPEAMVFNAAANQLILLSDDGDDVVSAERDGKEKVENKDQSSDHRTFRAIRLTLKAN